MARLVWRELALRDLQTIFEFIAKDSPRNAQRTVQRIVSSIERLIDYPRSGRTVRDSEDDSVRQVVSRRYRVFYRIEGNDVMILGIRHGAMSMTAEDLPHD